MPRPVVPMALGPRACSRALSSRMCDGRMSGQCGEMRSRSNTGTPWSIRVRLSASSACSDSTTPLPMKQRTSSRRIPEGIRERMVLRPPMTSVCPALWPPWKRATAAARSVRRSTTLPLPSSPHWVPMMTTNLPTAYDPLAHQVQDEDADQHAAEPGDAQLAVLHLEQPLERPLHPLGIEKRGDAFQHQKQAERGEQVGEIQGHRRVSLRALALGRLGC